MTALWIAIAVLAVWAVVLTVGVLFLLNIIPEIAWRSDEKIDSLTERLDGAVQSLESSIEKLGKLNTNVCNGLAEHVELILDHLGLEVHTEPAKSEPAKTTIRPKIERGES